MTRGKIEWKTIKKTSWNTIVNNLSDVECSTYICKNKLKVFNLEMKNENHWICYFNIIGK